MITTLRFTPTWLVPFQLDSLTRIVGTALVAGLFVLAGCGDKTPQQASAKETVPPESTVTPVQPAGEPAAVATTPVEPVTFAGADSAYQSKRYGDAVSGFTAYTRTKPSNPFGFYMLGLSAWKSGDLKTAEQAFRQSLALDSTHVKSYLNLSRVQIESGQPDSALATIESVLKIDETSSEAYRLQGRAHDARAESAAAVRSYHEALSLDPEDVWSMNNLGLSLIHQGAFDDALRPLARAVELEPGVATFQNNLGMALERTGQFTAAADAYRAAVSIDSTFGKASSNLQRVASLKQDPKTPTLDLKVLSQQFQQLIRDWNENEK
jgi:Flp pilus assembly protein TadD